MGVLTFAIGLLTRFCQSCEARSEGTSGTVQARTRESGDEIRNVDLIGARRVTAYGAVVTGERDRLLRLATHVPSPTCRPTGACDRTAPRAWHRGCTRRLRRSPSPSSFQSIVARRSRRSSCRYSFANSSIIRCACPLPHALTSALGERVTGTVDEMPERLDHLADNIGWWAARREEQLPFAERKWAQTEPTWGICGIPESEVGLLPANLDGMTTRRARLWHGVRVRLARAARRSTLCGGPHAHAARDRAHPAGCDWALVPAHPRRWRTSPAAHRERSTSSSASTAPRSGPTRMSGSPRPPVCSDRAASSSSSATARS